MHTADTQKQSLYIPSVKNIFKLDNGTLYRQIQDGDKSFKALKVPRSLIPTILINLHHLQGHAGTTKSYSLIKMEFFWKSICKDIEKFIQNWNISKQHNLQKQSYSYIHMTLGKRSFDSIACNLVGPFHPLIWKVNSYICTCKCLLINYPIAIPKPNKQAETIVQAYLQNIYTTFGGSLTMITDNGKEFKNDLFKKVADE